MKTVFRICVAFLICITVTNCSRAETQEKHTLIVLGSFNEVRDERWKDERIGFGVSSLISQAFYNTGEFRILEEKEEIREKMRAVSKRMWAMKQKNFDFEKEADDTVIRGSDYIAYGRIYFFGRPQTRVSIGVLRAKVVESIIKLEITLESAETGKTYKGNGTGKAKTTAKSALFTIREGDVLFDETAIGVATREAIGKAVNEIMKKYKK